MTNTNALLAAIAQATDEWNQAEAQFRIDSVHYPESLHLDIRSGIQNGVQTNLGLKAWEILSADEQAQIGLPEANANEVGEYLIRNHNQLLATQF
nr:hypothetical protein [uncultured Holophaga sp.]